LTSASTMSSSRYYKSSFCFFSAFFMNNYHRKFRQISNIISISLSGYAWFEYILEQLLVFNANRERQNEGSDHSSWLREFYQVKKHSWRSEIRTKINEWITLSDESKIRVRWIDRNRIRFSWRWEIRSQYDWQIISWKRKTRNGYKWKRRKIKNITNGIIQLNEGLLELLHV